MPSWLTLHVLVQPGFLGFLVVVEAIPNRRTARDGQEPKERVLTQDSLEVRVETRGSTRATVSKPPGGAPSSPK